MWFLGALVGIVGFVLGKVFSQSETTLVQKRRVYEAFLVSCPKPDDAYKNLDADAERERQDRLGSVQAGLLLYASTNVTQAVGIYLQTFSEVAELLTPESPALDPAFKKLALAHNDIILEMRRDVHAWTVFGYYGKSRLPTLETGRDKIGK